MISFCEEMRAVASGILVPDINARMVKLTQLWARFVLAHYKRSGSSESPLWMSMVCGDYQVRELG